MNVAELVQWLADTERQLQERGVKAEFIQRDPLSMDPDIRLTLDSDTVVADINIWTGLQEAELGALSVATGETLWQERIRMDDHDFDRMFSPILTLF